MDGSLGKEYLKNYITRAKVPINQYLEKQIELAKNDGLGLIALELLRDYQQMLTLGKGIRGALIELAYKACGGLSDDAILKTSIFIELFHSAILIHDDFMDRDPSRRGVVAIHKKYSQLASNLGIKIPADHFGNSVAVCIGNSGFYYAVEVLLSSNFSSDLKVKAGEIFSYYIGRLGLGQAMDMVITGNDGINEADALKVLLIKSAEYTSVLPMHVGAILAGETNQQKINAIVEYAKNFGWAFQIQDDVLGLFAKEAELGKPIGSDLREGKNTLLMIYLRKLGTPEQLAFQQKILGNPEVTSEDVEKMKQILVDSGTLAHVRGLAENYVNKGIQLIPQITSDTHYQNILESLIFFMLERSK